MQAVIPPIRAQHTKGPDLRVSGSVSMVRAQWSSETQQIPGLGKKSTRWHLIVPEIGYEQKQPDPSKDNSQLKEAPTDHIWNNLNMKINITNKRLVKLLGWNRKPWVFTDTINKLKIWGEIRYLHSFKALHHKVPISYKGQGGRQLYKEKYHFHQVIKVTIIHKRMNWNYTCIW